MSRLQKEVKMESKEVKTASPVWIDKVLMLTKKKRGRPRKSPSQKPREHETNNLLR